MVKRKNWVKDHMPTQRRLIQLYAALLYNAHAKGFVTGNIYTGAVKNLCVPGLNCYSCPGAVGACPLGALQNAIASSGNRAPAYILGILLLYGLILGRTICGFLCPIGLLQELLHKIPTVKISKNRVTHALSYLKYGILAVFVVLIPLWYSLQSYPLPAFCKYICPAGTLEGAVGLLSNPGNFDKLSMLGGLFTWKFVLLLGILGACVVIYRAFCRFLCPLGAIYGLFAKVAVIGVKVEVPKCVDCGKCVGCCPMDIRHVGDRECIHCGKCMDVCPTKAISFKAGKITLQGAEIDAAPEKKQKLRRVRVIAWAAALLLLAGALWFFNRAEEMPSQTPDPQPSESQVSLEPGPALTVGKEVGMLAPDFEVPEYGEEGETFRLSDHKGKTVVVNFWATWCSPCIAELPYFDALAAEYGETVEVIAIHSNLVTDDVEQFLDGFDYQIPFALDETGAVIASFGGAAMLPHTAVIDEDGVITYNAVGSVTYDQLIQLAADLG